MAKEPNGYELMDESDSTAPTFTQAFYQRETTNYTPNEMHPALATAQDFQLPDNFLEPEEEDYPQENPSHSRQVESVFVPQVDHEEQVTTSVDLLDQIMGDMNRNETSPPAPAIPAAVAAEKKPRVRVKTKGNTSRLTGLEDTKTSPATSPVDGKPKLKKLSTESTLKSSAGNTPLRTKRQNDPGDAFMAAFDTPQKKRKAKPTVKIVEPPPAVIVRDKNGKEITTKVESEQRIIRHYKGGSILRREPLTAEEKRIRKVLFEKDANLVQCKYFDIEDGERVNVSKFNNVDDMKHFEMRREGMEMKKIRQEFDQVDDELNRIDLMGASISTSPTIVHAPTQFGRGMEAAHAPNLYVHLVAEGSYPRGKESKLAETERIREQTAMAVFVDPTAKMSVSGQIDLELQHQAEALRDSQRIIIIPALEKKAASPVEVKPVVAGLSAELRDPAALMAAAMEAVAAVNRASGASAEESSSRFSQSKTLQLPLPFTSSTATTNAPSTVASTKPEIAENSESEQTAEKPRVELPPEMQSLLDGIRKADAIAAEGAEEGAAIAVAALSENEGPIDDFDKVADCDFRFGQMPTPSQMSVPPPVVVPTEAPAPVAAGVTADALRTLAALAGKTSTVGGIDLAAILSKVETAQSAASSTKAPPTMQYPPVNAAAPSHPQYAQLDANADPNAYSNPPQFSQPPNHQQFRGFPPQQAFRGMAPGGFRGAPRFGARGGFQPRPIRNPIPCKFYQMSGGCRYGNSCLNLHGTEETQGMKNFQQMVASGSDTVGMPIESSGGFSSLNQPAYPGPQAAVPPGGGSMPSGALFRGRGGFRGAAAPPPRRGFDRGEDRSRGRGRRSPPPSRRYDRRRYPRRRSRSTSESRSRSRSRSPRRRRRDSRSRSTTPTESSRERSSGRSRRGRSRSVSPSARRRRSSDSSRTRDNRRSRSRSRSPPARPRSRSRSPIVDSQSQSQSTESSALNTSVEAAAQS